ncbi:MAG: hypothetical protein ACXVB9_05560 [Bdellovibrionota bacterium]
MLAVLQELRARLGVFESHFQREAFPCSRLPNGLPRGILAEITGAGKTESVAQLLAENPALRCAWIEARFSLLPSALLQRGVSLEKIFFVEAGENAAWAAATVLRAQIFPIVVYRAPYGDLKELRRFQLLAGKSNATMILLGDQPAEHAWPIRLSLEAREKGRRLAPLKGAR